MNFVLNSYTDKNCQAKR